MVFFFVRMLFFLLLGAGGLFFSPRSHTLCRLWGCPGFSLERLPAAGWRRSTEKLGSVPNSRFRVVQGAGFWFWFLVSGFQV